MAARERGWKEVDRERHYERETEGGGREREEVTSRKREGQGHYITKRDGRE